MYNIYYVYSKPPCKKQLLCWQITEAKEKKFLISAWRSLGHYNDNKKRALQNAFVMTEEFLKKKQSGGFCNFYIERILERFSSLTQSNVNRAFVSQIHFDP